MWIIILIATVYLVAMTSSAHAYIDPGTGAIILQGIIAAMATGLYFVRSKFKSLLKHISGRKAASNEGDRRGP